MWRIRMTKESSTKITQQKLKERKKEVIILFIYYYYFCTHCAILVKLS